jgi:hypothetical protein
MRILLRVLEALSSAGGLLLFTLAVLLIGMVAEALHLAIGHDLALASLGALIAQLHGPKSNPPSRRIRRRP